MSQLLKKCKIEKLKEKEKGYLVGLYLGDGNIFINQEKGIYRLTFYLSPLDQQVSKKLQHLFGKLKLNVIRYYSKNGSLRVEIYSKKLIEWLTSIAYKQKNFIKLPQSHQFLVGFIEGMIDSDGNIESSGRVNITTANKLLLRNILKALEKIEIKYYVLKR